MLRVPEVFSLKRSTGSVKHSDDQLKEWRFMDRLIYMDNAATTRVLPVVFEVMKPYFTEQYGNPSSAYAFSGKVAGKITEAKEGIARILGCSGKEIFFKVLSEVYILVFSHSIRRWRFFI